MTALIRLSLRADRDVTLARQRARRVASLMGFSPSDQSRIATAVSEIARNAVQYARDGVATFEAEPRELRVIVRDSGPGIPGLASVLNGRYSSTTGLGQGILGCRRLMHSFDIQSGEGGTVVTMGRRLPDSVADAPPATTLVDELTRDSGELDPMLEMHAQNQALMEAMRRNAAQRVELEQANRALELARRQSERAARLRQRTLAVVSHDLRSPLQAVDTALVLIDRLATDRPDIRKRATLGRRAARRMHRLIDDLLDVSAIEAGGLSIAFEEVAPGDVVREVLDVHRDGAKEAGIALTCDVADCPNIVGDPIRLAQLLDNLVSNAIKFTPRGGRVTVRARPLTRARVVLAVDDTGPGIDADALAGAFEPFHQVEGDPRGAGLGLAICRGIARAHGGEIDAESETGRGTRFMVKLPVDGGEKS